MNLIDFMHTYVCMWVVEIKQFSEAFPTQSFQANKQFVYNVIHVGYFEGDVLKGYHGDITDTNK